MVLKMKYVNGWSFTPIPATVKVEHKTVQEKGKPDYHECQIKIFDKDEFVIFDGQTEIEPKIVIHTSDETYLLGDNGSTIEKLN